MRQQGCEGGGRGPLPMAPHGALHIGQDSRKASATMPCHSLITAVRAWEPGEAAGRGKGVLERGGSWRRRRSMVAGGSSPSGPAHCKFKFTISVPVRDMVDPHHL